jgi:hypothetical protein
MINSLELILNLHSHELSEAAGIVPRRTPQPTSWERMLLSAATPRGTFPLFVARVCPSYSLEVSG